MFSSWFWFPSYVSKLNVTTQTSLDCINIFVCVHVRVRGTLLKRECMLNFENSWNPKKDAFDLEMTKIEEKILFLEFLFDKDVNQKIKSSEIENLEKIKNFETKMKKQKSNSEPRNKLNLNIWF